MRIIDYSKGQQITIISLVANFLLSLLKVSLGILGNSKGLIADGINSISDVVTNLIVLTGIHIAKKPKDLSHPYGHGKVEPLTALIVGFILISVTFSIIGGVYNSIVSNTIKIPSTYTLIVSAIAIVTKEILFRKTIKEGRKINSESIIANAWDHRSDVYSSLGIFIGIAFTIYSANSSFIFFRYADSIAAVIVALLILKISISISIKAIHGLMDSALDDELVSGITDVIYKVEDVKGICVINGRYIGQHILLDIVIEVSADMSVMNAHNVSIKIEELLKARYDIIQDVMIHIEPYDGC